MRPPPPWMAAKTRTPPKALARNPGFMKKVPMMKPAIAVDATDNAMRDMELVRPLSRMFLYPRARAYNPAFETGTFSSDVLCLALALGGASVQGILVMRLSSWVEEADF